LLLSWHWFSTLSQLMSDLQGCLSHFWLVFH
jgi:hypothetical protein